MAARNHRNRPRRQRRRFGALYKLLSFLVIFAALLAGSVAFFRVNHISVTGNSRYTTEEVVAAAGVSSGENLLLVDRNQTAIAITDALPYVEKVSVIKRLPDTMELRVTESVAVAAVQAEGSWWLINGDCKLLERGDESMRGELPQVLGLTPLVPVVAGRITIDQTIETEQVKLDGLKNLLSALQAWGMMDRLSGFIDLSSGTDIYFGCGNALTVQIPISGDFDRRLLSLQRVLDTFQEQGEEATGTLDLTHGDHTARLLPNRWVPGDALPEASGGMSSMPSDAGKEENTGEEGGEAGVGETGGSGTGESTPPASESPESSATTED